MCITLFNDIRHAVRLNVIFSCHDGGDNDDLETF